MATVPPQCALIAQELADARSLANDLLQEFKDSPPGQKKSQAFNEWRAANSQVKSFANALERCLNPPPPLPDLVPVRVAANVNAAQTAFDAAVVINNQGAGPAPGPFKITLGVTYVDYSQDPPLYITPVATLQVPNNVTIQPGATYTTSDTMKNIPINHRPGTNDTPLFDLYILVDSDFEISESLENNNNATFLHRQLPFLT
jgi:hypothetical protein